MEREEIISRIDELEREIALLPKGSIARKKIHDKEYFYHRVSCNGKRTERFLSFEEEPHLRAQLERRKELEKELKELKKQDFSKENLNEKEKLSFKVTVRYGKQLKAQVSIVRGYRKRECINGLREYIKGPETDKVLLLYGLRRTGKTTLMRQIIAELTDEEFDKAAFIQVKSSDRLADIDEDIRKLEENGFKYLFIDEVTLMEDFIEGAALFADIYAGSGMKIVLSGTDSLGFAFAKAEQLYDRCLMIHTTFIPYREFENVLGVKGIEEYIRYGGTMSLSGINYNSDTPFANAKSAEMYIDTAIARNIQHSLKLYEYGGHFRHLLDLYEKGELTNVINRVVENINHEFTRNVVQRTFKSHDVSVTAVNLLKDRENAVNIKKHLDMDALTHGIMKMLDIINIEQQSVEIEEYHMSQIKEYLSLLDLTMDIDLEFLPEASRRNITVITQPGLRYAQARAIVENMLIDEQFKELSAIERKRILDRLLSEICGRMMEEIVLLETKIANPEKRVFKLQFAVGEFDMVIFDPEEVNCEIYEIKYSKAKVANQSRHLVDREKCEMTSHRFGEITGKYVIYRGESDESEGVRYINVEEYLKAL